MDTSRFSVEEGRPFAGDSSDDEGPIPASSVLGLAPGKASRPMLEALHDLRLSLLCPLCGSVFRSPMTGPCGHSFCNLCIDEHSCHHSDCPVDGCSIPLSMSSRGKSYRQVNPALETAVTSFHGIIEALRTADDLWWDVALVEPLDGNKTPALVGTKIDEGSDEEEDEMIDLNDVPLLGRTSYGSSSGVGSASDDEDDNNNNNM